MSDPGVIFANAHPICHINGHGRCFRYRLSHSASLLFRPASSQAQSPQNPTSRTPHLSLEKEWKDIQVGDAVRVESNDFVPADLIPISSSEPERSCHIETSNLGNMPVNLVAHIPPLIGGWFSRRKAAAKKAGNSISEDTYELSLDPPPPPPPAPFAPALMSNDLERKNNMLSSLPGPTTRGRLRARKRIKIKELSSDIDTAYTSASSPFSDGRNTLVASSSGDRHFSPAIFHQLLENHKGTQKRAYSHFSDEYDSYEPRLKDPLFSPASANTNNLIYDTHLSLYSHPDHGLISSSLARPNQLVPNHLSPFIRDATQKLCSQGASFTSESSSNLNSGLPSGNSAFSRIRQRPMLTRRLAICSFEHAKLIKDASSYDGLFERTYNSEHTLSALLSSDILFESHPFSDSQNLNATLPAPVPTTIFTSVAFLYRLPNFPALQTRPRYFYHSAEYLQRLESLVPLSDSKSDLSSFDQWARDETFEMKMTDEMLDELVRRMSRKVQSEDGIGDEEMGSEADSLILAIWSSGARRVLFEIQAT
ncbi:hypothetical protein PILCRDRAFT_16359 [Piloderma croceum F 1598]|uniref:Uncharacterized protein n=1 Tax=Piloderma croceum (strain F 1598) TaxID=765440 RepID=A0A0C3AEK7_PILCF|nr:hypothetical protein PILCRDRAFT_16359 [Piloderma croceum F 1598]